MNREYITKEQVKLMLSELLNVAEKEKFSAYDVISHAPEWLDKLNGDITLVYLLDRYERIKQIVKCEQSATTCEHTRLKSFDMIESILSEEYTRKEYGDLADIIILHDQMVDSGELEH